MIDKQPEDSPAEIERNIPKPRARPRGPRLPLKALDDRGLALLEAMVYGVDESKAAELGVEPHRPLRIESAAKAAGLKIRNARFIFSQQVFLAAFSKELAAVRSGHKARAVRVLADIMEEPGANLAADRAVRVKASSALLASEGGGSANLSIGVGISSGVLPAGQVIRPGVVIKLKSATAPQAPIELEAAIGHDDGAPEVIDVTPNDEG